ncbi:MAG: PAS domain S-box protein [Gemmatimonadota bacterium]
MRPNATSNGIGSGHRLSQAILDTLSTQVAVVDEQGSIIAINSAWTHFVSEASNSGLPGIGANYLDLARLESGPYAEMGSAAFLGITAVLDGSLPHFALEYQGHSALQRFLLTVSPLAATSTTAAVVTHLEITGMLVGAEQFRELALHIPQALWVMDAERGTFLYVSPGYSRIWGRSGQSLLNDPGSYLEAIHPADRAMMSAADAAMCQTGHLEVECHIVRPDQSVRLVSIQSFPVLGEQGRLVRSIGVVEDITERKAGQDDHARLAAIVDRSDDAIVSSTLDGIVLTWNPGAERLYGYVAEEMVGRSISVLFTPDHYEEYLRTMERATKGEEVAAYESQRLRKDGKLIEVSASIAPILVSTGEVVGISRIDHDLAKVKLLEAQFRQAQKMEAVGRLAGGVAHDFNNLLTIIAGYSEILLGDLPPGDPGRDWVMEIKKAGQRASALTRQLLAFSRKQVLEQKVVDLNAMVTESRNLLERLVGDDVDLVTRLDPDIGRVKTDLGQLEQSLMNLVVNARDAIPQGGMITIETGNTVLDQTYCRLHPEVRPGPYVMLAVSDTGCGMNEETMASIFEPFFTTKRAGKGTGLGLAMVHGFITQSGGLVVVRSEPGLGSTFKIFLPQVDAVVLPRTAEQRVEAMPQGRETILLVEYEAPLRALARHVLQACGYKVLEAAHADGAIRLAERHKGSIHLLLTDVVLQGMGARVVAERIAVAKPAIKVLYLGGYADQAVSPPGAVESYTAILPKPFTPSALAVKVRAVLDDERCQEAWSP